MTGNTFAHKSVLPTIDAQNNIFFYLIVFGMNFTKHRSHTNGNFHKEILVSFQSL